MISREKFRAISASEFFYRNREIAGFDNPVRATYTVIRELVENSLDSAETHRILPSVYVRLRQDNSFISIKVVDNGSGVPREFISSAFGKVLFGSKYTIRQTRGTFGLGGKMAILYGQITTNSPVMIMTGTGGPEYFRVEMMIDVEKNEPNIRVFKPIKNDSGWHGTQVEFRFDGDYSRAKPKIVEYFKETATILPYAQLTFIDPDGVYYEFNRVTENLPSPPTEVYPHPHGVDTELLTRLIKETHATTLAEFVSRHFHRVGVRISEKFLRENHFKPFANPKELPPEDLNRLADAMRKYNAFLPPDASCLSPIGPELMEQGIRKEFNPEMVVVEQRRPSAYGGHPFIVETAIAFGGGVPTPPPGEVLLHRYANKIPLLYDSHSDVSMKVIRSIKWWRYKIDVEKDPVSFFIHLCSTKIPYKTVGKEYLADRPEIEYEIEWALKTCARKMKRGIVGKERVEWAKKKAIVLEKYLPKIAQFSTDIIGQKVVPDVTRLIRREDVSVSGEHEET